MFKKFISVTACVYVGRYVWNTISVQLRSAIGPSTDQAIMEWVRLHSESVTGRQGYAAGYKRNVELEMLDPTGVVVQKWLLVNVMLGDTVNFGQLQYSGSELATVDLTLRPDYCVLAY